MSMGYRVLAQGPTSYWYFGDSAGLKFENYNPAVVFDNSLMTFGGPGTLSDINGNLLFYSNPTHCIGSNHLPISNSDSLIGNILSSQGSMLIPHMIDPNRTFLITNDYFFDSYTGTFPNTGHYWHLIQKNIQNPFGKITKKNNHFSTNTGDQLTAVHHANGRDIWLITTRADQDTIWSYLLTDSGVVNQPIISSFGIADSCGKGSQLKASSDGKFIARTFLSAPDHFNYLLAIYQFNSITGNLYNPILIPDIDTIPYVFCNGVEFSSNNKFLYFTHRTGLPNSGQNHISRCKLINYDSVSVNNSLTILQTTPANEINAAMQIGIDRNIYYEHIPPPIWLGKIDSPDSEFSYDIIDTAINLSPGITQNNLPDFIQSYFHSAYFDYSSPCANEPVQFFIRNNQIDSIQWDFGDPASGINNTSNLFNPIHLFTTVDTFGVTATIYQNGVADSFYREIVIVSLPELSSFQSEYHVCVGDSIKITIPNDNSVTEILWSDSNTSFTRTFETTDSISFRLYNFCDTIESYIKVIVDSNFSMSPINDTTICDTNSTILFANTSTKTSFHWSNGSNSNFTIISTSSSYMVSAFNSCDTIDQTFVINFLESPMSQTLIDTIICAYSPLIVNLNFDTNNSHLFINPSKDTLSQLEVSTNGIYYHISENYCGQSLSPIQIELQNPISVEIKSAGQLCFGNKKRLFAVDSTYEYYHWSTGDSTYYTLVDKSGMYFLTISDKYCFSKDSILIFQSECDSICEPKIQNVITPNNDGLNDIFKIEIDCPTTSFSLHIYSRWGQLVFSTNQQSIGWDASHMGSVVRSGTYFFVLEYLTPNQQKMSYKGNLTVISDN